MYLKKLAISILPMGSISANAAEINNVKEYVEQKIFCNATIEDDFSDDRVLIVLNKNESQSFKAYQASDFSNIN